ncbi:MAG TPA: ATP-binding protein [Blastocatellia bacterium]|nr:ATP-binding protein [Blastocatellia bacterium]
MPGHRRLQERVHAALDRCQESQAIEFKESAEWESLKWGIIRTLMAMANLRDGGVIIVGASEHGETWDLSGIDSSHLSTYQVDEVTDAVNKYASPPLSLDIVLVPYGNNTEFLAIRAREFELAPCVCKRNGPDQVKSFREGEIYIRPAGKAQTKKVTDAHEPQDLLELAAERRARRMIETAHRIGFVPAAGAQRAFDDELQGL